MSIRPIASVQNENFKMWKQLSTSKGIRKNGCFFLMGEKLINEFLDNPDFEILAEVLGPQHTSIVAQQNIPKFQLTAELFAEIDTIGTHFNLLLLKVPEIHHELLSEPHGLEAILPLGDPGNMGAALRAACAFGIKKVFLTEEACHPFHPKTLKASAGASLKLKLVRTGPLQQVLASAPAKKSLVLDQGGTDLSKYRWQKDIYLFVGEEGPGLPPHKLQKISITTENVESLNAAMAASIAYYSYKSQL